MDLSSFRVPTSIDEVFYIPDFINAEEEEYLLRKAQDLWQCEVEGIAESKIAGGELAPSNVLIPQKLPSFITDYPDLIARLRATGVFSSSRHGQPNHVIVNEYQPGQGIMPHEDGPTYYPTVATLSLGSHTVFNYHRYLSEQDLPNPSDLASGRPINTKPMLSLLLEPRSLVITAKALYTHHLHAIESLTHDVFLPAEQGNCESCNLERGHASQTESLQCVTSSVRVENWKLLSGKRESQIAREGGVLERGTRVSLTCRDVERTVGSKVLGKVFTL